MVDSTVVLVVRILAGCATITMVSSPSLLMRRICKQKHVGVASVFPLAALLANSHIWMMYGYLTEIYFPIFSCFLYGDLCALTFIFIYTYHTTEKRYVAKVVGTVVSILLVVSLYAILGGLGYTGQTREDVGTVVGLIADVAGICLYGAPMEKLMQVLKHKSAVFINVHMVIAGFVNNCIWFTYGMLITNWFIIALNVLFICLGIFTLCLYRIYDPKTHPFHDGSATHVDSEDDGEISVEIELSPQTKDKKMPTNLPSPEYSAMRSPLSPLRR